MTNAAYDVHHPLAQVQAAFNRAGEPKKLVTLPYDTVGLYSEPGLGVAMRHAIAWYDRYLLADAKAEAEAEALSRARPWSPLSALRCESCQVQATAVLLVV